MCQLGDGNPHYLQTHLQTGHAFLYLQDLLNDTKEAINTEARQPTKADRSLLAAGRWQHQ